MFDVICTSRGKAEVVFTGDRDKAMKRIKTLRQSRRGDNVTYVISPSQSREKFRKVHRHREH